MSRTWLPPHQRPPNESAGWLGYYTRTHLPVVFDLVDADGSDPVQWFYWKQANQTYRFIEEKPLEGNWKLHPSEERTLRVQAQLIELGKDAGVCSDWSGVYVLQGASQLLEPLFPISVRKIYSDPFKDTVATMDRHQFDKWLICDY